MKEQRLDLIEPYTTGKDWKTWFGYVEGVPVDVAKQLLTGYPNVAPTERQNRSPSMKKLIEIAESHEGSTLFGYVIPLASKRDDSRITFDGIMLKASSQEAHDLKAKTKPDEFTEQTEGVWRFWWD